MDILGRDKNQEKFHNMVDDPYYNAIKRGNRPVRKRKYPFNATGGYGTIGSFNYAGGAFNDCCGYAATGDDIEQALPEPIAVKSKVQDIRSWQLLKTGLALVGLYVAVKFVIGKLK